VLSMEYLTKEGCACMVEQYVEYLIKVCLRFAMVQLDQFCHLKLR
jgi:hypothetical protein